MGLTGGGAGGCATSKIFRAPASTETFRSLSNRSVLILGSMRLRSVPSFNLMVGRKSSTERVPPPRATRCAGIGLEEAVRGPSGLGVEGLAAARWVCEEAGGWGADGVRLIK